MLEHLEKFLCYSNDNVILLKGNVLEILPLLPYNYFDLILTDPPYESLRRWEGVGTTGRMGLGKKGTDADNSDKLFPTISNSDLIKCLNYFFKLLKEKTHCYVMCDTYTLSLIYDYNKTSCWSNLKPLIWNKQKLGMGYHYRCQYEFILMFDRGKNRKLNNLGIGGILTFPLNEKKEYPTQKSIELFELLINQSSNFGEIVFDPFIGSGTTAIAAIKTKRQFIGIDINEKALNLTIERIKNEMSKM